MAKIWIDDTRPMPEGYSIWCKSVNEAKHYIITSHDILERLFEKTRSGQKWDKLEWNIYHVNHIELLDFDNDAGDYAKYGGDYIKLMDWMEENQYCYPIRIHTANPVAKENMLRICRRNDWIVV